MTTMRGLCILLLLKYSCSDGKLFGDHVCQTEIIEPREVVQWELKNKTVRTYKWCMSVPPRCSVYSNKVYNETKISIANVTKSIEACCEGFHERNGYCISLCQDCKNGLCLKGTCICQNGWEGPTCDSRIPSATEVILPTVRSVTLSTIKDLSTSQPSTKYSIDNTTKIGIFSTQLSREGEYSTSAEKYKTSSISPLNNTGLPENTFDSSTKSFQVSTENFHETMSLPSSSEETHNSIRDEILNTTSSISILASSEEIFPGNVTSFSDNESNQFIFTYSTKDIFLDTTATTPALISSAKALKESEINSKENNNVTMVHPNFSSSNDIGDFAITEILTEEIANHNADADYREIGGQSSEVMFSEPPKEVQNSIDKDVIAVNVFEETKINSEFPEKSENIEETSTLNIPRTTWNIVPVIDRINILREEKQNSISKEDFRDTLEDFTEERYQKRSSIKDYGEKSLATSETDSSNLIYSICAASATTVIILIVAISIFTVRNSRKKVDRNKGKKDVATVAVYTTSIFHSPLPDPPTFENPTYLSTGGNECWKEPNEEIIEVQDFNVIYKKPIKHPKLGCKQYLYDHPPSTGSYRASSEVDTLSQYNFSNKSVSGLILEPVYDEIPSRDNLVERNLERDILNQNNTEETLRSSQHFSIDNNSLYVNTLGRTVF